MTKMEKTSTFSRRALLKAGGALVVSIGMPVGLDRMGRAVHVERKSLVHASPPEHRRRPLGRAGFAISVGQPWSE